MNQSIKAKILPLFPILDLNKLRRETHLEDAVLSDFSVGWDQNIYLLFKQMAESQDKSTAKPPAGYTVVELKMDWAGGEILDIAVFPLGRLKFQFRYMRAIGEEFLLFRARSAYRESGPEQNAWIVSRDGTILSRFCLGDGIQNCVVKADGTIVTGYFDEGVFGNYGWADSHSTYGYVQPIGECGLIAWTPEGIPLCKNEKYPIYDCYAISLDAEENLWFYYYNEFRLVRMNFKEDFVFELPIEGSGAFSVAPSGDTFLFQGGYQKHNKFYFLTARGGRLGQKQKAIPTCGRKQGRCGAVQPASQPDAVPRKKRRSLWRGTW